MHSYKDKLYLQTRDMPTLNNKINKAIELSRELALTLNDLADYKVEFVINAESEDVKNTPVAETTDVKVNLDGKEVVKSLKRREKKWKNG